MPRLLSLIKGTWRRRTTGLSACKSFEKDYKIVETTKSGIKTLKEFFDLFPEWLLSISYYEASGHYALVYDVSKLTAEGLKRPGALELYLKVIYFLWHGLSHDFAGIRNGMLLLAECGGFDLKRNFGLAHYSSCLAKLGYIYPFKIHQLKLYHTGVMAGMLVSMGKHLVPEEVHRTFQLGNVCEIGRLGDLYMVPTVDAAQQRILRSFDEFLSRRYRNEAAFCLPE
jgi:hypothetical protein